MNWTNELQKVMLLNWYAEVQVMEKQMGWTTALVEESFSVPFVQAVDYCCASGLGAYFQL